MLACNKTRVNGKCKDSSYLQLKIKALIQASTSSPTAGRRDWVDSLVSESTLKAYESCSAYFMLI